MRLVGMRTSDVPGVPAHLTWPDAAGVCVIHAARGHTKTAFIELVAAAKERIGPYGVGGSVLWPSHRAPARVALRFSLDAEEREFAATDSAQLEAACTLGAASSTELEPAPVGLAALLKRQGARDGQLELVPAERSLLGSPPGGGIPGRVQQMLRLSTHVKKYAGLVSMLVAWARDGDRRFDAFRRGFDQISPVTQCIGTRRAGEPIKLVFQRGRRAMTFDELGLDEHQYVLFAALAAMGTLRRSILLIDEPELHLGESDACRLVEQLGALFADDTQIFAATRSDAVAAAVPAARMVRLDH